MSEIKPQNSSRISEKLLKLHEEFVSSTDTPISNTDSLQVFSSSSDILQLNKNGTGVIVRITSGDVEGLLPALEDLGFEVLGSMPNLNFIEGWMPINLIPDLENLDSQGLLGVLPVFTPITNVGSVTSQADFVHETDRVRASLPTGFNGTGVTVGVLSDSYDISGNGSATADIASGDLPAAGVNVLQDLPSGGGDEGRAMLQLIHDLAPGADLAFATAFISPTNFANNIRNLANAGSEIIVDDVGYLTEPFFQDGVVSLAVDDVVTNNGVAYFSSAGNSGNIAYESANINFVSDTIGGISGNFYDFDSSPNIDTRQRITIPDGQRIRLSFQWDDPFFTTSGVDTDLNIFLLNAATGQIVANSSNNNILNQTPSEFLVFTNNTGQTDFDVAIQSFSGPEPGRIKYIPFDLGSDPNQIYQEFATNSSTIFAHPAATNASAVAAVPYFDQQNPESFTSIGPTTILFEQDGTRKTTPEIRQTPDIAAIDATDTTFFGSDIDGNGFPNFSGTSAAAPHAAAVAALVKQANPTFTPEQIYNRLESTAIDIGITGFDNVTGHGLINAYDAIFGSVVPTSLNFSDDFEDGDLPLAYETNTNGAGRIQVTTENNPIGTQHLTLDAAVSRSSLNEVILHVNTTGFNDVQLSFDQREFGDEDEPMPSTFTGSNNSDGVALSVDGTNWFSLISLTGSNSTETYQTQTFNLSTFAANNGLTLGSDVRIKFQQFDNFPINSATSPNSSDGFAFDNISVTGTDVNEGVDITESDDSTEVTEDGETDTYTVVLNSQPTSDVTIDIDSGNQTTTDLNSLTFTRDNWNIAQTVTVNAIDDPIIEGNHTQTITHVASSSDTDYNGIVIDSINVNISDNDTKKLDQTNSDLNIFTISGETSKSKLQVNLTGVNSDGVNELGVFIVDDIQGSINGILPGASGYTEAALERAKIIFSALTNSPNGFDAQSKTRLLEFDSGANIRFYLIDDSTTDAVKSGRTSIDRVIFSDTTTLQTETLGEEEFSLAWNDRNGSSNFNDLVVNIQTTQQELPIGTNLQNSSTAELIDLTGLTQSTVSADFSVFREAAFNNEVYFYKVDNASGEINGLTPNTNSYLDSVLNNIVRDAVTGEVVKFSADNQGVETGSAQVETGSILAPLIIVDGSIDQLTDSDNSNNPAVYFPYIGANSDGVDHIRLLANNTFGFEDLPGGGDKDYNDLIVTIDFTV